MPEFLLIDGPLAGQVLSCVEAPVRGALLDIGVVDVGQEDLPRHGYVVESAARWRRPGRLRHARTDGAA